MTTLRAVYAFLTAQHKPCWLLRDGRVVLLSGHEEGADLAPQATFQLGNSAQRLKPRPFAVFSSSARQIV